MARTVSGGAQLPFSFIAYKNSRFLITDAPDDATVAAYADELHKHHVKAVR